MQTEVILTKNIQGLGAEGDKVIVRPGYARNYLIPRGIARLATQASIRHIDALKKKRVEREAAEKTASEEFAKKISALSCTITVKTSQNEKMFGSVTTGDIHDYLTKHDIQIERRQIALDRPIHQVGEHHVTINLLYGVTAHLKVVVAPAESPPAPAGADKDKRGFRKPYRPERTDRKPGERRVETKPAPAAPAARRK